MEDEKVINKTVKDHTKAANIAQTIIVYLLALLVPTFLGEILEKVFGPTSFVSTNSQLIIGTIVNMTLVVAALNFKGWGKILGVVTMPSIATILGGYVFGTSSVYMVWMIPAIWIGNFILVYSFKFITLDKGKNYFLAGIVGIALKVIVIFGIFNIIKLFNVFPEQIVSTLQTAMGLTQLKTAILGVLLASIVYFTERHSVKESKESSVQQ